MQIKTNQSMMKKTNTGLVRRWLEMILPLIMGYIFLPYLFLFLGSLYTEEFNNIPAQIFFRIVFVQGILVIATPVVTAWIILKRVSKQLQTLLQVISQPAEKIRKSTFVNDHWITLEKQHDDLGLAARQIKAELFGTSESNVADETMQAMNRLSKEDSGAEYSSLFSMNMKETNTQVF